MPNIKVIKTAEERREARAAHAQRVYDGYSGQVEHLISHLAGPSRGDHNRAIRLLTQMGHLVVPQLLKSLQNSGLKAEAVDELVSLLGNAGDWYACEYLWEHFRKVRHDPLRASLAALSLAKLGDPQVLPFIRQEFDSESPERVLNAVTALRYLGELEDISRLRALHCRCMDYGDSARDIRKGAVNAILAILDEVGDHSANRVMDQIRTSFADRALWNDISAFTEYSY